MKLVLAAVLLPPRCNASGLVFGPVFKAEKSPAATNHFKSHAKFSWDLNLKNPFIKAFIHSMEYVSGHKILIGCKKIFQHAKENNTFGKRIESLTKQQNMR